jgi:type II secretory pathway component PulM
MRKSNRLVLFLFVIVICASGCQTFDTLFTPSPNPYLVEQDRQLKNILEEQKQKQAEINNRSREIEQARANGKISEGEYLILKNNLLKEMQDFDIAKNQQAYAITQQTIYNIDRK